MSSPSYAALDEALASLAGCGPALANGNFNHAPMVAEALCALGRPEAVMPWIARYRPRLLPRQAGGEQIRPGQWREALGGRDNFAAWADFFAAAMAEAPWRDVLDLWAARLAPGVSAAATHGAIRVGHAVRGLAVEDTAPRRAELAAALASWAASYSELPAAIERGGDLPPEQALQHIAVIPPERRRPGNIVAALEGLYDVPEFAPTVARADLTGISPDQLTGLTELFARAFLANVHNVPTAIAFVHGVTSLAALGHIVPHVDEATARSLLRYGWQAGCGLYACYGSGTAFASDVPDGGDAPALIDRAVANGDEHVIKFTEACLSRHRFAASPAYPAAILHLLATMPVR